MSNSSWLRNLLKSWLDLSSPKRKKQRRPSKSTFCYFRLVVEALEDRLAPAAKMVADIYPGNNGSSPNASNPSQLTDVAGTLFFMAEGKDAQGEDSGGELWMSNGTPSGTHIVKDIFPGKTGTSPNWSFPSNLTNVNGKLLFTANDGVHGTELWKSNGTFEGTKLVKDIFPGMEENSPKSSNPQFLTNVNGTLFFIADNGIFGHELWKSDGTEAGTKMVKDINPGSNGILTFFSFSSLTNVNGTLYFSANDGSSGNELWRSDGTPEGTKRVKDINPGSDGSDPYDLTEVNGTLFFRAYGPEGSELWKTDGTENGTELVKDIFPGNSDSDLFGFTFPNGSNPRYLTNVNGTLFFTADDGANGRELWKSNGTAEGTLLVRDVFPGTTEDFFGTSFPAGSSPSSLINVNGTLYFQADHKDHGRELWKSNGTAAGTELVKDIFPGSEGSFSSFFSFEFEPLTNVNGTLFFQANDGSTGFELWKSDGTRDGTKPVMDIQPGKDESSPKSSSPSMLTNVNGALYFTADDGFNGRELWSTQNVVISSISTKESRSIEIVYDITYSNLTQPLEIGIYRSKNPTFDIADIGDGDAIKIKQENIVIKVGDKTKVGTHSIPSKVPSSEGNVPLIIDLTSEGGLTPNTEYPYVLAVLDPDNKLDKDFAGTINKSAYFRTYVVGAVVPGFNPAALGKEVISKIASSGGVLGLGVAAFLVWLGYSEAEWQTAVKDTFTSANYDQVISFFWDSGLPNETAIKKAGQNLYNEIVQAAEKIKQNKDLKENDVIDLHIYAHSRGTVVTSLALQQFFEPFGPEPEIVKRLGFQKATIVDPHPANNDYGVNASFSDGPSGLVALAAFTLLQSRTKDPSVKIPERVNEVELLWQKTPSTAMTGFLGSIMNLHGLDPSIIEISKDTNTSRYFYSPRSGEPDIGHTEIQFKYLPPGIVDALSKGEGFRSLDIDGSTNGGSSTSSLKFTISPKDKVELNAWILLVKSLVPQTTPVTVILDLKSFPDDEFLSKLEIQVPKSVTLHIQGNKRNKIFGGSPSLTVTSGNVILSDVTLVNDTDAPTVLLEGGNLKLRNVVVEESTSAKQKAIVVNGGTLDLGTEEEPGQNTVNVNGSGSLIQKATASEVVISGNSFQINGAVVPESAIVVAIDDPVVLAGINSEAQPVNDNVSIQPFGSVTLTDPDANQDLTVTVTFDAANGAFTTLAGFTGSPGSYSFTGKASAAQAALQALEFTPTPNQVAVGSTVSTSFTITFNDGVQGVSDSQTTVVATSVPKATTVSGKNAKASFNSSDQTIILAGTVTSNFGLVNEGTLTFSVRDQSGNLMGTPVTSGNVVNGQASADFILLGGTARDNYQISVAYSGGAFFLASDNDATLFMTRFPTTPETSDITVAFQSSNQVITLKANVTSDFGLVNEGNVTFTIRDQAGTVIGKPVFTGEVVNGQAQASYMLPGGTPPGAYHLAVVYNGGKDFFASREDSKTLTIAKGATTTLTKNVTLGFRGTDQKVSFSATVGSGPLKVNLGAVTFTVEDSSGNVIGLPVTSATVRKGKASASYVLPAGTPAGTFRILAQYQEGTVFSASGDDTHVLTLTPAKSTTGVKKTTATASAADQAVLLSATVTSRVGVVNGGTVTFTVMGARNSVISLPVVSQAVANGQASVSFTLPGGLAVGRYRILASYSGATSFLKSAGSSTFVIAKATLV